MPNLCLEDLIIVIGNSLENQNQSPKPFFWTAKTYDVLKGSRVDAQP
jgi:hypothetical protein